MDGTGRQLLLFGRAHSWIPGVPYEPQVWDILYEQILVSMIIHVFLFTISLVVDMSDTLGPEFVCQRFRHKLIQLGEWMPFKVANESVQFVLSCFVLCNYVQKTYTKHDVHAMYAVNIVLSQYFQAYYIFWYLKAESKKEYVLNAINILDLSSIISMYIAAPFAGFVTFEFARVVRLLTSLERLEVGHWTFLSSFKQIILYKGVQTLSLVVIFASVVYTLEILGDPAWLHNDDQVNVEMTWFESIYFILVTITTVGYGDFYPVTFFSRIAVVVMIIAGVIFFSFTGGEVIEHLVATRDGKGQFVVRKNAKFVVLIGSLTASMVEHFCVSFFAAHGPREAYKVVALVPTSLTKSMKDMQTDPRFEGKLYFFSGSCTRARDLERVKGQSAQAYFCLVNKSSKNLQQEDSQNIIRVLAIKRYFPKARVYAMCGLHENKQHFLIAGVERRACICVNEIRMGLLGLNCLATGASTLIANLISKNNIKEKNGMPRWKKEYIYGTKATMIHCFFPSEYINMTFLEVHWKLTSECNIIPIGIAVPPGEVSPFLRVTLHPPGNLKMRKGYMCILMGRLCDLPKGFKVFSIAHENKSVKLARSRAEKGWALSALDAAMGKTKDKKAKGIKEEDLKNLGPKVVPYQDEATLKSVGNAGLQPVTPVKLNKPVELPQPHLDADNMPRTMSSRSLANSHSSAKAKFKKDAVYKRSTTDLREYLMEGVNKNMRKRRLKRLMEGTSKETFSYSMNKKNTDTLQESLSAADWATKVQLPVLSDASFLKGHIVVVGDLTDTAMLFETLRDEDLRPFAPIVLVSDRHNIKERDMETASNFEKVYFIDSSGHDVRTIQRICADASSVIVLSNGRSHHDDDSIPDSDTIVTLLNLESCLPHLTSKCVDLIDASVVKFLNMPPRQVQRKVQTRIVPKDLVAGGKIDIDVGSDDDSGPEAEISDTLTDSEVLMLRPRFAAGALFLSEFLEEITAQAFFQPELLTVIEALVAGQTPLFTNTGELADVGQDETNTLVRLLSIRLPLEWEGQSFLEISRYLMARNIIAIGFYRSCSNPKLDDGGPISRVPRMNYVYTCPHNDSVLYRDDYIYVISKKDEAYEYMSSPAFLYAENQASMMIQSVWRGKRIIKVVRELMRRKNVGIPDAIIEDDHASEDDSRGIVEEAKEHDDDEESPLKETAAHVTTYHAEHIELQASRSDDADKSSDDTDHRPQLTTSSLGGGAVVAPEPPSVGAQLPGRVNRPESFRR